MLGIFLRTVTFVPVPVGVPLNARPVVQFSAPSRCSSRMLDDADRESRRRDDAARRSEYSADLGGTDLDMSALRERSIATLSPPPSHPRPLTPALSPPPSRHRSQVNASTWLRPRRRNFPRSRRSCSFWRAGWAFRGCLLPTMKSWRRPGCSWRCFSLPSFGCSSCWW